MKRKATANSGNFHQPIHMSNAADPLTPEAVLATFNAANEFYARTILHIEPCPAEFTHEPNPTDSFTRVELTPSPLTASAQSTKAETNALPNEPFAAGQTSPPSPSDAPAEGESSTR